MVPLSFVRMLAKWLLPGNLKSTMAQRYFLDDKGAETTRIQGRPGAGHIEIAREVLPQHGVAPGNDQDVYIQMFNLKFVRILENDDGSVEVEHGAALTAAQKRAIKEFERQQRVVNIIRRRVEP